MADCAAAPHFQQVDGLWFDSDLVILRTGNRIFRVFTAVLKAKSPVFATMFSLPQPASAENIAGVPVVDMQDDPVEFEVFLKALFDTSFFASASEAGVDTVLAVLRLAHKYDVDFLRRRALKHFDVTLCTRVENFDLEVPVRRRPWRVGSFCDDILRTIKVLVEVGALWMLPSAYYILGHYNPSGPKRLLKSSTWGLLGDSEQDKCLRLFSRATHMQKAISTLSIYRIERASSCTTTARCNEAAVKKLRNLEFFFDVLDVLGSWDDEWEDLRNCGLCGSCLQEAKDAYTLVRLEVWHELPELLDLPDWAALEQMREGILGPDGDVESE